MINPIKVQFTIHYQCTGEDGSIGVWNTYNTVEYNGRVDYDEENNSKKKLIVEFSKYYEKDPNFKILHVFAMPTNDFDWDLMERMSALREMCELGRKVRANTGIRNRQPLGKGYVAFANQDIQNFMLNIDCSKREYAKTLEDELNVLNLEFLDEELTKKIFNFNLKPNFKVLGPKGFGKQAQDLKTVFQAMSIAQKNELHAKLKSGETVEMNDIPLTYTDIEVEFSPKKQYMSSTGKVGAIVLDTTMNETLLDLGFVAEFRSAVQALRRESGLELTDKIFLEVFCAAKHANVIEKYSDKLKGDLLATGIDFFPPQKVDLAMAHRIYFDGEVLKTEQQVKESGGKNLSEEIFYVGLYKIAA